MKTEISLRTRIGLRARIVMLVMVAIVPLFGMSIFKALHNADAAVAHAKSDLQFAASLAAAAQERVAGSVHQVLTAISYLPGTQDGKNLNCDQYSSSLTQRFSEYANLGILGLDGYTRCHALGSDKKAFAGDRAYFRNAITQRRLVAGPYTLGRLSGKPVIPFAQPITDADGKVTGVAFAALDLTALSRAIADSQLPPGAQLIITDRAGTVIAAKPEQSALIGRPVPSPVLQEAVKTMRAGVLEGPDALGGERIFAFLPSLMTADAAFFVAVSMGRGEVVGPSRTQLWLELATLALVAFLGGWMAWLIGGSAIVAPTRQILHATRQLEKGHLNVRIPVRQSAAQGEFSRIAASFNLMADSLEQREQDVKKELARGRQAYSTLELTINSMQEGLMAVDTAGRLLMVNETAARLFAIDNVSMVLAAQWPQRQGLFVPGTQTLYAFDQLPLYKALQGESGGPLPILMRNEREPAGRLISCSYRPMQGAGGIVGALMVFADITQLEQLQMEQTRSYEQLREVQRKLLNAQRLGRIGNWELSLKTRQLWWSDEVYELYGLTREDFDGSPDTVSGLIHPDDRPDYERLRDAAMRDGLPLNIEYRIVTPAGQTRWIHQHGEPHADSSGAATLRAGVVQDITGRKLAEQAAARTTELLRRTGEMGKIGGWEMALDGMQLVWSEQIYRIHELDPATPVPNVAEALAFYASEARPLMKAAARAAAEHGTPWDLELPLVTATGRRIWVRTQGRALRQDGKIVRVVGALQDITEQHDSQEQLRLLETSISRLNDIVLITEADPLDEPGPRIVFVNDAFERRTGYSREEVLGRSPRLLQGPNTQRAELDRIVAALRKREPVRAELINYKKDGEAFWLDLDIVPIADAKGVFTHWVAVERDITKRKLSEQALVDSEQRYAALFESAPVSMWIVDAQTLAFLAVNEAAVSSYGYSRDEFLHLSTFDIRPRAEQERLKQYLAEGFSGAANRWLHVRKDGFEFPVETVSRAIHYLGREARFVVATNIAAQVKAENDVQAYLFTLQRAAEAAQAITWHQTLDGMMQEVAEQARAVIGAHQAAVSLTLDGNWAQAIHALSLSEKYAKYRDLIEPTDGCGIYALVCEDNRSMRLTQAELEAHPRWQGFGSYAGKHPALRGWLAAPLMSRSGKNIGLLQLSDKYEGEFTQQDEYVAMELAQLASIAIENARLLEEVNQLNAGLEQKVAERTVALARQEALFRALAEQAPQVVWTLSPTGAATYFNRAWFDLVGGKLQAWTGTQWLTAFHPEDLPDIQASWQIASASQSQYVGIRRLLAKDGSCRTMSYRASPVLDENGSVLFWVGIDADVTEIKAIETALRLSNQELEAFSYSVSHDLRSPLNTVDGFSRLLAKQFDAGNPNEKVQHYLSRIQAGVAQMGRLIEDLLSLAQVSRMQLRHETVDLSVLAREIADECQVRNPERVASISIEDDLRVQGDGRLIRVAMENLVGNAWKFTSQRSCAEIKVGHKTDSAGAPAFFVQDNGAGFDMAYADKLFNTFQRLHAVTEFPGTGVGLATVSRVIGRHGGQVWAESEPGKGATFFFTLPGAVLAF